MYKRQDLPREESFARLVDTYKKIAAIAEQKGIELVLEQLQPYESNLVLNLQDIKRVLDEVDVYKRQVQLYHVPAQN